MNRFDLIWESIIQDLDESFGALTNKLPAGFLKAASVKHRKSWDGTIYGKQGGIPGFGRNSEVVELNVPITDSKASWAWARNPLKDKKVVAVIVEGVDSGEYIALMADDTKIGYGWSSQKRKNLAVLIYASSGNKYGWYLNSSKKNYEGFLSKLAETDTHVKVLTVYTDFEAEKLRAKRGLARSGMVPLPDSSEYSKYIDAIKSNLRSELTALIRKRAPQVDTDDQLMLLLKTEAPQKFNYKGINMELYRTEMRGVGSGVDKWNSEGNYIEYRSVGYGEQDRYMKKYHPTIEYGDPEWKQITQSLPESVKIFFSINSITDIEVRQVIVYGSWGGKTWEIG